ncbi:MAG: macro domain-containing protein [Candidatus Heimdallarchaeota archaeon]|nr:macro domain-containing protein [Candidatus Heimdallarchaeota archaeon]
MTAYNKVKIVKGNILYAPEDIIVQSVNCQGVMGKGLALQLRNKYPKMFQQYKARCNLISSRHELLGSVQWYYHDPLLTGRPEKIVANIFGQLYYGRGRHTDYDAFASGFLEVSRVAKANKLTTAIPFGIGCGLGGGDWNAILAMIESRQTFVNRFVTLYKLEQ